MTRVEEIKQPKRREVIKENAENARMSKQLVRLATDAPVPLNLQDLDAHDKERPNLKAFLEEQGFKTLLARLGHDASNIAAPKNKENTQNTSPPDLN